jgi:aryl-alcohol dehydrogenase-like predicted oxidoreductase
MVKLDARKSGSFKIGGDIEIHRLGFGAMRITGPRVWGPPLDRAEAIRTLKRLPELGIDFIDTADSYGPDVSEQLIHETLYPYDGILIATKAGLTRPGPGEWERDGRPGHLRKEATVPRAARARADRVGSCTASIRKCRAMSSSPQLNRSKTMESSVTLG